MIFFTGENIIEAEEYYFKTNVFSVRKESDMIHWRYYHNNIKKIKLKEVVNRIRSKDLHKDITLLGIET